MVVEYYDSKGKLKDKKTTLKDEVFNQKVNKQLLSLAVVVFNANQRQSTADTKERGEVRGGGRKPWKQKGTARARAGSSRSPIWTGGGVTFGPSSEVNFKKKMNKTMRKAAIKSAFSLKAKDKSIVVFEDIALKDKPSTADLIKVIKKFVDNKVLIIQPKINDVLFNSARNLKNVNLELVNEVNVVDVLKAEKIIILEQSLDKIYEFWADKKTEKTNLKAKNDGK